MALDKLKGSTKESDVVEVLSKICDPEHFPKSHVSPKWVAIGCKIMLNDYEEVLERSLSLRNPTFDSTPSDLIKQTCSLPCLKVPDLYIEQHYTFLSGIGVKVSDSFGVYEADRKRALSADDIDRVK